MTNNNRTRAQQIISALLFVAIVLTVSSPLLWYLFKSTIAERH